MKTSVQGETATMVTKHFRHYNRRISHMDSKENTTLDDTFIPLLRLKTIGRLIYLKGMEDENFDLSELRADEVHSIGEMILSAAEEVEQVIKEARG